MGATAVDERRLRAWQALGIGPAWVARSAAPMSAAPASQSPLSESPDWAALAAGVAGCTRCGLCSGRTHTVFGAGSHHAQWLLVGDAPGADEDALGEPFTGPAGQLLDRMLAAIGLDRSRDVFATNLLKCRPPGDRSPLPQEVSSCEPHLSRQIALLAPRVIVALGQRAAQALLRSDATLAELRGRAHPYASDGVATAGATVIVTFHPLELLRHPQEKSRAWADLCLARAAFDTSL
jgi:DNA polymerase